MKYHNRDSITHICTDCGSLVTDQCDCWSKPERSRTAAGGLVALAIASLILASLLASGWNGGELCLIFC